MDTSKVTRFEVIGPEGRTHTEYVENVLVELQDDGRTLKVFFEIEGPEGSGSLQHLAALRDYFRTL